MEQQQSIAMTKQNAEALLNYLASKPYAEVQPFIAMIQACPMVNIMPSPDEGKAPDLNEAPNRAARRRMTKSK